MRSETGNQTKLEIIAYHGWGFDSGFWNPWKKMLPGNVSLKTADRGYYLEEKRPRFSGNSQFKILIMHSFGLHWCPTKIIKKADCTVIFNGFKNFHRTALADNRKSKLILNKMISGFENDPEKVLQKFWENTFYPEEVLYTPENNFDATLLLEDLKMLNTNTFDFEHLKTGTPIISIDGGDDKILGAPLGKAFTEFTEGNAVYHFIKEAGHGLPVTHLKDSWSFISAMIPIFQRNGNYRKKRHQQGGN